MSFGFFSSWSPSSLFKKVFSSSVSVNQIPLPEGSLSGILQELGLNPTDSPADLAKQIAELSTNDQQGFVDGLERGYAPITSFMNDTLAGLRATDPIKADRTVFVDNLSGSESGHALMTITEIPLQNPDLMKGSFYMKVMATAFPGVGVLMPDGTPGTQWSSQQSLIDATRSFMSNPDELMKNHTFRVGYSSYITALDHYMVQAAGGTDFTAMIAQTTDLHALRGIAPWISFTDGTTSYSSTLNFGEAPIVFADVLNETIAPVVFKELFRVGTIALNNWDSLVQKIGADASYEGFLNASFNKEMSDLIYKTDPLISRDIIVLSGGDCTVGKLLAMANAWYEGTAALKDPDTIEDLLQPMSQDELIAKFRGTQFDNVMSYDSEDMTIPPEVLSMGPDPALIKEGGTDPFSGVSSDPFSSGTSSDPFSDDGPSDPFSSSDNGQDPSSSGEPEGGTPGLEGGGMPEEGPGEGR